MLEKEVKLLKSDIREINLSLLWNVLKKCFIKMIIIAVIAAALMGVVTEFAMQKRYSSSIKFYVVNNTKTDYISSSYLSATEQLANDYIDIIRSDVMLLPLSERLEEEFRLSYSASALKGKIITSTKADSSFFEVRISDTDKEIAHIIASCIAEMAPDVIKNVVKDWSEDTVGKTEQPKEASECVKVMDQPKVATKHDSPNLKRNVLIAFALSAIIVYAIYFLIVLNDTVLKTEEDIKMYTDKYPLIGIIPFWEV